MFLEYITFILPKINVEVTNNVCLSVICVYFRQAFMENFQKKFVWLGGRENCPRVWQ